MMHCLLVASVLVFHSFAYALPGRHTPDPGPIFGPEFTVTNPFASPGSSVNGKSFVDLAIKHLVSGQPEGAQFTQGGHGFLSPNDWSFNVENDFGVLEITMKPMTVNQFEKHASDIQDAIFVTAANVGLFPGLFLGGGHINIDLEYLLNRPMLFRNFMADLLVNHVELFMGIFGYDTHNALPLVMKSPYTFNLLQAAFAEFDRQLKPTVSSAWNLKVAIHRLMQNRQKPDYYFRAWKSGQDRFEKYHSVYFDLHRLELRAVRPQASINVWNRQIRLLRNRMRYLEKLNRPIRLNLNFDLQNTYADTEISQDIVLNPPISARQALLNFKQFVAESGENIADHLDYVWPHWQSDASVAEFILENGFVGCDELLKGAGE